MAPGSHKFYLETHYSSSNKYNRKKLFAYDQMLPTFDTFSFMNFEALKTLRLVFSNNPR